MSVLSLRLANQDKVADFEMEIIEEPGSGPGNGGGPARTTTVDVRDAPEHLAEWLLLVKAGTEVILTDGEAPFARLVPISLPGAPRIAGLHPGAMEAGDDFDEPLQLTETKDSI